MDHAINHRITSRGSNPLRISASLPTFVALTVQVVRIKAIAPDRGGFDTTEQVRYATHLMFGTRSDRQWLGAYVLVPSPLACERVTTRIGSIN
jgi:hypothetical protein